MWINTRLSLLLFCVLFLSLSWTGSSAKLEASRDCLGCCPILGQTFFSLWSGEKPHKHNGLYFAHLVFVESSQETVAVIKPAVDECPNQSRICCRWRRYASMQTRSIQTSYIRYMVFHGKMTADCHTKIILGLLDFHPPSSKSFGIRRDMSSSWGLLSQMNCLPWIELHIVSSPSFL